MADLITVRVTGTESVTRAYATITEGVSELNGTWASVGALAAGAGRAAAPKRTGWLAMTISSRPHGDHVVLTAGAVYAGVIEWGWRARGIRPNRYLYRGILNAERAIAETYAGGLEALVAKAQRGE